MKRGLIAFILIVIVVLAGYYLGRSYILPAMIAKSISSEGPAPKYLPDKIEKTVTVLKKNVNEQVDELPKIMKELDLSFEDLIYIVEHVDADEVLNSVDELNSGKWSNTDEAYDIVVKNIHVEGYDLEKFRPLFNKKARPKKIKRILNAIEENNIRTSLSIPVARNTAKRILLDNREKIETKLDAINGG
jgi:hypothetical protein